MSSELVKRSSNKDHREILRLYEVDNKSYQEIANMFNLSRERIRQIINGIGATPRRQKISERNKLIQKTVAEKGIEDAIEILGIPEQIIRRIAGPKHSIRKQWYQNTIEPAIEAVRDGMSVRKAAKLFQTTEITLAKYCQDVQTVSRHGPHRDMTKRIQTVRILLSQHFSYAEIADVISKQEQVPIKSKSLAIWINKNIQLFQDI